MRVPFAVGRWTRTGRQVVVVGRPAPARFPGPWALRALVQRAQTSQVHEG